MCAIFGILGEYNEVKAKKALNTMLHRGPDSSSIYEDKNLFFAHQALHIIDSNPANKGNLNYKNILASTHS